MNHARKRFGQHFLEPAWIAKVIGAIGPECNQTFLEIGPGRGALTRPLASRAKQVIACEIDRDLVAELQRAAIANVTIVEGDFLKVPDERLSRELTAANADSTAVRVAGNLPYNVGAPILFRLLALFAAGVPLVDATVMLQRDVADRLTARPGTRDYGVLSILIGHAAAVERLMVLPPGAFRPAPKVYSAVVRLVFHPPTPPVGSPEVFAAMVQAIFTRRRKTLANALGAFHLSRACPPAEVLLRSGLDGGRRPETLSITEFVALADAFSQAPVPPE
ncbi:MAG: 16S rRNA (adenine(1518)-N(6)/adenine(1519)-N(6))-dimethyltransferase RsmA [Acidobacteriota bacterium]